ncbi:ABC transporter permease [Enterovirga rhinocerotis]|uniref:Putative ABC transport system permease protein n=1 Tax=Enterovirga rhinocerotis TaxID=1339210 RepID=A0A4V3DXT8_9HYPH|nr:FtsX-like permease family protein [Enterovirga rhinocerotis]TDR90039.1 putative ABC transport system permease protein [Enterovirga rhinocerotis]
MHGTLPAAPTPRPPGFALAARLALRELRAGLSGFAVFIACIALGVAAIAGVNSVAHSLVSGITTQGRVILGGDLALSVVQREATVEERRLLARHGKVSAIATLRAMANAGDAGATLVELKAVRPDYPEIGAAVLDPPARILPIGEIDGSRADSPRFDAVADPTLFDRLGLKPGAEVTIGQARFRLAARLLSEPDKIAAGIGFGPRFLISLDGLRATGLVQPGSLVRWTYRITLPEDQAGSGPAPSPAAIADTLRADLPDDAAGWEIRTRDNADPRFTRNIERFTQFLTLVGLTALLVGGVGVANAVAAFVDRKRVSIGILKSLGATGGRIVTIYLLQVMAIALLGIAIGLAFGAAIPFAVAGLFGAVLPIPIDPIVSLSDLGVALLYGLLTALAFSLAPLGRAHAVPVSGLFRDRIAPDPHKPPLLFRLGSILAGVLLVALAIGAAYDKRVALLFVGAAGAAFLLLRVVAIGLMAGFRRLPPAPTALLRLAVANLYRPGALTPTLVLSLGLGITLLVTITTIDANLRREIGQTLPDRAPNFFFIDIPSTTSEEFRGFLQREAPGGTIEATPMMRGRLTAINGTPVAEAKAAPNAAWVLDGDRGITYSATVPEGSTVIDGEWWAPDVSGPPLVSMDAEIAKGLGLAVGDSISVNVLGRAMTAKIANMRRIEWRRIGIGFVLVFSPQSFAGAPHSDLMTLTLPKDAAADSEARILREAARRYPAVSSVRVKDALEAVNSVVSQLLFAIRAASSVALAASLLVLAGALAAGHRARLYDAVILKTLGATRPWLLGAYLAEYGVLGLATALFGILAGTSAAALIVSRVMNLEFMPDATSAIMSAGLAVVIAIGLGLAGTWRILGQKPAPYLRTL